MAGSKSGAGQLSVLVWLLKTLALVCAVPVALVAGMALVGRFTESGWIRLAVASLVLVAVPALLSDRLIPAHDPTSRPGIVSDVFSVFYVAVAVLAAALSSSGFGEVVTREGDRLHASGHDLLARVAWATAGRRAEPVEAARPDRVGAASSSASASAASAPASVSVPAANDAGAEPPPVKSATPPQPGDRTPQDLFKELAPSVVSIRVKGMHGMEGGGTGFFVADGIIATNHHVISNADSASIKLFDDQVVDEIELLEDDASLDLAILRVSVKNASKIAVARLGDSESIAVGERVLSIGNPLGLEHTLTDGLVSARRVVEGRPMIQMSAPVSPGNSGGPLFNMRGEVVGVTTAQLGDFFGRAQNLNLAVPVNALKPLLRSEHPGRRTFGKAGKSRW